MAVNDVKAANVTKYDAGGSGDNYIPDGYIKTVEKIWSDTYTLTGAITLTNTSIIIARIPSNKKIMGIDVVINTSISHSNGTISIGHSGDAQAFIQEVTVSHALSTTALSFPGSYVVTSGVTGGTVTPIAYAGYQMVTNGTTGNITLKLNNWVASSGTIKTVVHYT